MKLLTTPALKLDGDALIASPIIDPWDTHEWWFCYKTVRELFDVPWVATKVWFEFHDRPSKDRYKVEALDATLAGDIAVLFDDKFEEIISYYTARLIIKKIGTLAYVECYYE